VFIYDIHLESSAVHSDAQNVKSILLFPSMMSSGPRKTAAPILRAHEMAYLAFNRRDSSSVPGLIKQTRSSVVNLSP